MSMGRGIHGRKHVLDTGLAALAALVCLAVSLAIVCQAARQTPDEGKAPSTATAPMAWDEATAPNYYLIVGPAEFDSLPALPAAGEVVYAPLDELGRAGGVVACIDSALAREEASRERKNVSGILPSGWGFNEEVDIELPTGGTYHGFFWNRSHLLAKSLGGDEAIENLVCGTRMQNVGANVSGTAGGMAYPETLARDWLEQNPHGFVRYSATPEYMGNEPVCRNVVVNVLSSDGSVDCKVVVFNAAKGYVVDYATGRFAPSQI